MSEDGVIRKKKWNYKEWYAKERVRLNRERREKYHSNKVYREKVKERASANYHTKRRKPVPIDRRAVIAPDGNRFYSIGRVARVIGRGVPTIRQYHQTGILPQPIQRDKRGWRLYNQAQLNLLKKAFSALDDSKNTTITTLKELKKYVVERWNDPGNSQL